MRGGARRNDFWDAELPVAIAHRGGAAAFGADKYRKENTLAVFAQAVKMGYGYLELDVIKTADDKVIVLHVASYKIEGRLGRKDAPSPAKLQELTHKELKDLLGRDIPTLDILLSRFPATKFFVDAKTDEVVEPLANLINKLDAYDRVVVGSFFPRRLTKTYRILGSEARLNLNISRLPLKMRQDMRFIASHNYIKSVHLPYLWATKRRVNALKDKGVKVLVWTPNTRERINKTIQTGADGIISDNATLLKEVLADHKSGA
ncbi:MAG TPA: glycerophosphodiester phosphodiesterase [Candidatus Saccharimonadales bacterium]|nr:glycerophosphodiester phosphodiesterase [Candidatus Saccharimonadales bacterium]